MDILVFALFLVSLTILVAGLLSPDSLEKLYGYPPDRQRVLTVFGVTTLVLFFAFMFAVEPVGPTERELSETFRGPFAVRQVIDGDTIEVGTSEGAERVRLIGVDAPEVVHPERTEECYGQKAADRVDELLDGKEVVLLADRTQGNRDRHGRLLRYVYMDEGESLNRLLLEEGMAYEYTHDVPYRYQSEFSEAEVVARDKQAGLWSEDTCDGRREIQSGPAPEGVVKMSSSGICHAPSTTYYEVTINFTPYEALQDCLDDGGRLPRR